MNLLSDDEVDTMRAIAERLRANADCVDSVYGFFPGGDPRDFTPDPEASTEEERRNHKRACELFEAGKITTVDGRHHFPVVNVSGEVVGHVTHAAFGLGVYNVGDRDMDRAANELDALLDRIRELEERYR